MKLYTFLFLLILLFFIIPADIFSGSNNEKNVKSYTVKEALLIIEKMKLENEQNKKNIIEQKLMNGEYKKINIKLIKKSRQIEKKCKDQQKQINNIQDEINNIEELKNILEENFKFVEKNQKMLMDNKILIQKNNILIKENIKHLRLNKIIIQKNEKIIQNSIENEIEYLELNFIYIFKIIYLIYEDIYYPQDIHLF